ncbi:MAG: hypothetical protein E6Q59_10875 [Nitrosomonas sp.]|nr:hypothetical protein [Nitrosomonas sp.]OQW82706.1 MAG: hypothetical protein BVN30_08190 [Proteobacteria bacterium ST_bin16]TXI35496.1 MAG: hypothetical protein E6Q59_10875 [Nitrosomonas sp.]
MTASKHHPSSKKQPVKNLEGIKELQKARLWLLRINGVFRLIDCRELLEIDGSSIILSMEQMCGVYRLLDGIVADLEQIQMIATEYGKDEKCFESINGSISHTLRIISLAVKIAESRIADDDEMLDVPLSVEWVNGFFTALSWAREYLDSAEQDIEQLHSILLKIAEGGVNAIDTLH